jgi:hypothetical protein
MPNENDDDLAQWRDDPLVRALRSPGAADELAGEEQFLAAFRAAQPAAATSLRSGRLRRAGRRLGGGGTAVVVAIALGAGAAAAAYTQNLPEPVQRAVHGVLGPIGVPAPEKPRPDKDGGPVADPSTTPGSPTEAPHESQSDSPTSSPSDEPSDKAGDKTGDKATDDPTDDPSETPTESPTGSPTTSPTETTTEIPTAAPPALVTLVGTSHRAGVDEQVALSGVVSSADQAPVADQEVTLQQRQGRSWTPVATASTDAGGALTVSAPTLTRTSLFRLGIGDTLTSAPWRVVLVPTLTMSATPGAVSTGIDVTARGGQPGDVVTLLTKRPGGPVVVGRDRLDASLTASFQVAPPSRRVRFLARLPRTRAHAAAGQSLPLEPVVPTGMSASVPDTTPGPRDTVTVTGTVTGDGGAVLSGRKVVLLLREPGAGWRRVGSAVSGSTGSVSIPVGPLSRSVAVRLRTGRVQSPVVRLRLQPELSAYASPDGSGRTAITATAVGGSGGDVVLLRAFVGGRLVTVQQGTPGPAGSVRFVVDPPARGKARYVLALQRTPSHLKATAAVVVRAQSR